jgi:hypothetical protein
MTYLVSPDEVASAYVELRTRVIALLREAGEGVADLPVPHCPAWTVKMAVSHLVGVPEDVLSGNMEGVTTEAWTQAQVDRHANDSLMSILDTWEATVSTIDPMLPHFPVPVNSQFVFDACTHEHDVRAAIGQAGARDSQSVRVAAGFIRNMLSQHSQPEAQELLSASINDFDFVRSMSGRRSMEQIASCGLNATAVQGVIAGMPVSVPTTSVPE